MLEYFFIEKSTVFEELTALEIMGLASCYPASYILKRIAVSAEHKGFRVALLIKGPEPAGEYFGKEQNQLLYVLAL